MKELNSKPYAGEVHRASPPPLSFPLLFLLSSSSSIFLLQQLCIAMIQDSTASTHIQHLCLHFCLWLSTDYDAISNPTDYVSAFDSL
jgi:hypothetical protein